MNNPSDPDPFQRLTNRLRESTFSTLAGGARAQSAIDEHSDGEQTSKIAGNMVVLNNEAHLPRHAINRTSCELRMASTNYANQSWKNRLGFVTASLGML